MRVNLTVFSTFYRETVLWIQVQRREEGPAMPFDAFKVSQPPNSSLIISLFQANPTFRLMSKVSAEFWVAYWSAHA